jgi:hypothetical protein
MAKNNRKSQASRKSKRLSNGSKSASPPAPDSDSAAAIATPADPPMPPPPNRESIATAVQQALKQHAPNMDHHHEDEDANLIAERDAERKAKEAERQALEAGRLAKEEEDRKAKEESEKKGKEESEKLLLATKQKEADLLLAREESKREKTEELTKKEGRSSDANEKVAKSGEKKDIDKGPIAGAMAALAAAGTAAAAMVVKKGKGEDLEKEDIEKLEKPKESSSAAAPDSTMPNEKPESTKTKESDKAAATGSEAGKGKSAEANEPMKQSETEKSPQKTAAEHKNEAAADKIAGEMTQGFLYKPRRRLKNRWVQRYYVLNENGNLSYRLAQKETQSIRQFQVKDNIRIVDDNAKPAHTVESAGFAFIVNFGGRDRMFTTFTDAERTIWLKAFKKLEKIQL